MKLQNLVLEKYFYSFSIVFNLFCSFNKVPLVAIMKILLLLSHFPIHLQLSSFECLKS